MEIPESALRKKCLLPYVDHEVFATTKMDLKIQGIIYVTFNAQYSEQTCNATIIVV